MPDADSRGLKNPFSAKKRLDMAILIGFILDIAQGPLRDAATIGPDVTYTQSDEILVPGMAVVDPLLDHETTQPSPYPAIQIPENTSASPSAGNTRSSPAGIPATPR